MNSAKITSARGTPKVQERLPGRNTISPHTHYLFLGGGGGEAFNISANNRETSGFIPR